MDGLKRHLLGLTLDELRAVAKEAGMPAFTGAQMAKWLYDQHVGSIDEMTNISKKNRETLKATYDIGAKSPIDAQHSKDGTIKYLFPTDDGKFVETVFIPEDDRATLCVSSQVGCKMNCLFCQTGKQGFQGSLSATDILNQLYSLPERDKITNIVFMGQGEPMDNLDNVLRATGILTASYGYAWSPKRITVSSVGVKGKLQRFLDESECHVAISLHSPFPEQRSALMPAVAAQLRLHAPATAVVRVHRLRRTQRLHGTRQGTCASAQRPQLPHKPHPIPPDSKCAAAQLRREEDGEFPRLSHPSWHFHHHPGQPRTGHLRCLRTAQYSQAARTDNEVMNGVHS